MLDEEGLAREFCSRVASTLEGVPYELIVVDDGSTDGTAAILDEVAAADERVRVLHLSRPFGHQMAITAGLDHAIGDAVVMLDGDLQDPPELIPDLVERWREGADIVVAKRRERAGETRMKLATARWFYAIIGPPRADRARAQRRRLPALRPRAAGRAAAHARALALPARHELVGRLPARRRRVRPRRPQRRADEVPARPDDPLRARRGDLVLELPAAARGARRRSRARRSRWCCCR